MSMKTIVGYMGGKSRLAHQIYPFIADHKIYIEPFFGTGAVFFYKGRKAVTNMKSYLEIIGDLNFNVVNFFRQLRKNHDLMIEKLEFMEYSESMNNESKTNGESYKNADDLTKACLWFFNIVTSFSNKENGGFAFSKEKCHYLNYANKVDNLKDYVGRLKQCYIINKSYDILIDRFDTNQSFFYFDPPYKDTQSYRINKDNDFNHDEFAKRIKKVKGKWMLSHYRDDWLEDTFKNYHIIDLNHKASICRSNGEARHGKDVKECLVLNYEPDKVKLYKDHCCGQRGVPKWKRNKK